MSAKKKADNEPINDIETSENSETTEEPTVTASDLQMEQLQRLQKEATEYKEKYFTCLAELENMRKRLQKEKQEMTRFAAENVLLEFLAPMDSFEQALGFTDQMSEDTRNWAKGFEMLLGQFKDILTTHGVEPFNSEGKEFNTDLHEAVEVEETEEVKEDTIVKEFLCGYKRGDRILRPARVKVAKKPKATAPSAQEESQNTKMENDDV